jgi:hypothetical protein
MTRPRSIRGDDIRVALAQEAARIMFEHGIDDYGFAKRKAAERLGASEYAVLPKNAEIDAALIEYQRLFAAETHEDTLSLQRQAAVAAMELLADFEPRLVGPVLTGTATPYQTVALHLFCDFPESISMRLMDQHVRYNVGEQRVRMNADRFLLLPTLEFDMHDIPFEAIVFPRDGIRQAPLSASDGKPARRASLNDVRGLVEAMERVTPCA